MTYVVSLRPNYELATMYGWFWCGRLYNERASLLGYDVIDLAIKNATQDNLLKALDKDPKLIAGVCHGNTDIIVGQDNTLLFRVGDENTKKIVKGRHVWMLSCLAGQKLLPWMVQECGAVTAMGYREEFVFCIDTYPNSIAEPFFRSHFAGIQAFLRGRTAKDAFDIIISTFKKYLDDPKVEEAIKPYLLHDMKCAVFYGDPNAKIGGDRVKVAEVTVKLERVEEWGRIVFTVVDSLTEIPIQGAHVVVKHKTKPLEYEGDTDEEGKLVIDGVEIAEYFFTVEKSGYKKATGEIKPEDFK